MGKNLPSQLLPAYFIGRMIPLLAYSVTIPPFFARRIRGKFAAEGKNCSEYIRVLRRSGLAGTAVAKESGIVSKRGRRMSGGIVSNGFL